MAQPTNLYKSSDLRGAKEDVDDKIYNLDPEETPFISSLPSGAALKNRDYTWQEDSYVAANKDNSMPEGDDFTAEVITPTFVLRQHVQTFRGDVTTSGIANHIAKYGRGSEQDYQMEKKAIEIRTHVEAAALSVNPAVAASGSTAHKMAGLELYATSSAQHGAGGSTAALTSGNLPTVAPTDGTLRALTQAIFTAGLRAGWENGLRPKTCFLTMSQKAVVDGFAGIATKQINVDTAKMVVTPGVVNIYDWETGPIAFVPVLADRMRSRTLFVTDGKSIKRRTMRPISRKKIAATGDSEKEMFVTDTSIQVTNRVGVLKIADLS